MITIRAFFPKLGHFFSIFEKGQWTPPFSYAPLIQGSFPPKWENDQHLQIDVTAVSGTISLLTAHYCVTFLEHFRIRFQSASLSFYVIWLSRANFGSLSRQQSHPSDATYWFLAMNFRPEGHWEQPRNEIGSLSLVQWSFKQGPYEFVKAAATATTFKFAWNLLETWFFSLSNTI